MDVGTLGGPLLTLDEVRQRLVALSAELHRLERDRSVFARAFHTTVAQAVHAALTREEARLTALPTLELTFDDYPDSALSSTSFDVQRWSDSGPGRRREILDV